MSKFYRTAILVYTIFLPYAAISTLPSLSRNHSYAPSKSDWSLSAYGCEYNIGILS